MKRSPATSATLWNRGVEPAAADGWSTGAAVMVPAAIAMRSARRARLRIVLTSTALRFTGDRALVVFTRIAARGVSIPRGMMSPRPPLGDGPARHRLKGARLLRRALVDMNDESHQHEQRGNVVKDVTQRPLRLAQRCAETTSADRRSERPGRWQQSSRNTVFDRR